MQLTINQTLLAGAIGAVNGAVSTRTINPVLGHIRLRLADSKLTLTATDGDFMLQRIVNLGIGGVDGDILVPAGLFKSLVDKFTVGKEVAISLAGNVLTLACGRSSYDLTCMDVANFPELPEYSGSKLATLPASQLRRGMAQTEFAAAMEASGGVHYTNGVLFAFSGPRLDIVATDGHRLALKRNSGLAESVQDRNLLLPARVAAQIVKLLPDEDDVAVELFHHGNQLLFAWGTQLVASTLFDIKFPDYERVIPKDIQVKIHCDREELEKSLSRVLLVCRQKDQNPVARLLAKGDTLTASSDAGELGKGSEQIACEMAGEAGDDVKVALNPGYLIEALKVLSGPQVTLNWLSDIQPVMLTSSREPDFTYIVMPIRMD